MADDSGYAEGNFNYYEEKVSAYQGNGGGYDSVGYDDTTAAYDSMYDDTVGGGYETGGGGGYDTGDSGGYDTGAGGGYDTGDGYDTGYDTGDGAVYDTGGYDTTAGYDSVYDGADVYDTDTVAYDSTYNTIPYDSDAQYPYTSQDDDIVSSSPWTEYWDENGQAFYWYNNQTGESTYDNPFTTMLKTAETSEEFESDDNKLEVRIRAQEAQSMVFKTSKNIVDKTIATVRNMEDSERNIRIPHNIPLFMQEEQVHGSEDPRCLWSFENFNMDGLDLNFEILDTKRFIGGHECKIKVEIYLQDEKAQLVFKLKDAFLRSHSCKLYKEEIEAVTMFQDPDLTLPGLQWELIHKLCDMLTFTSSKNDQKKKRLVVQSMSYGPNIERNESKDESKGDVQIEDHEGQLDRKKQVPENDVQIEDYEGQLDRKKQFLANKMLTVEEKALKRWVRCWDNTNSAYYFYNLDSNESSWDPPEGWSDDCKASSEIFVKACLRLQACIRAFRTRKKKAELWEYKQEIRSQRLGISEVILGLGGDSKNGQYETRSVRTKSDVSKNETVPRLEPHIYENDPRLHWGLQNFSGTFFLLETKRFIAGMEVNLSLEMILNKLVFTITDQYLKVFTLKILTWEIEELIKDDWPDLLWPDSRWLMVHKLCDMVTFVVGKQDRRKRKPCFQHIQHEREQGSLRKSNKLSSVGGRFPLAENIDTKEVQVEKKQKDTLIDTKATVHVAQKEMKMTSRKSKINQDDKTLTTNFTIVIHRVPAGNKGLLIHARNNETVQVTTLQVDRKAVSQALDISVLEAALLEKTDIVNKKSQKHLKMLVDMAVLRANPFDRRKNIICLISKEKQIAEQKAAEAEKLEKQKRIEETKAPPLRLAGVGLDGIKKKSYLSKFRMAATLARTMRKPLTKEEKLALAEQKRKKRLANEMAFRMLGKSLYNKWLKKDDFNLLERAFKSYEKGMASIESATNPKNLYALSRVYMAYASYQSALEIQSRIISSFPTFPQLYEVIFDAAVVLCLSGSYVQGRQYYSYVSGEKPHGLSEEAIVFQIARSYELEGKESESTSAFIALFRAQRKLGKIRRDISFEKWFWGKTLWEQFGDFYMARHVFSLGADCYYEAMRRVTGETTDIPLLFKLGNAYYRTHQNEPAKQCAESVLVENPFHREARNKLVLWDPDHRGKKIKEQDTSLSKVQGMIRRRMAVVLRKKRSRAAECMRRCGRRWVARRKLKLAKEALNVLYGQWMEVACQESRKNEKMKAFIRKLQGNQIHDCYANWKTYIIIRRSMKRAALPCFFAWKNEWIKKKSKIKHMKNNMLRFQMMMGGKLINTCFKAWKEYTNKCLHAKALVKRQLNQSLYKCLCAWHTWAEEKGKIRRIKEAEEERKYQRKREKQLFIEEQQRRAIARAKREAEALIAKQEAEAEAAWLASNMEKVEKHRRKIGSLFCKTCFEHWKLFHEGWGKFALVIRKQTHRELKVWMSKWKQFTTASRDAENLIIYRTARFGSARYFDWFEIIDEGRANEKHIHSAIVMQRGWRHMRQIMLWRKYVYHVVDQLNYHVKNLQRVWRGKQARKRFRKSIPGIALLEIQRMARGHLARRRITGEKNSIRTFWAALMLKELGIPPKLTKNLEPNSLLVNRVHEQFPLQYPGRLRGLNPDAGPEGPLLKTPEIFLEFQDKIERETDSDDWKVRLETQSKRDRILTARMKKRGLPGIMKKRKQNALRASPINDILPECTFSRGSTVIASYMAPSIREKKSMIKKHRKMYRDTGFTGNIRHDEGLEKTIASLHKRRRKENPKHFKKRRRRNNRSQRELIKLLKSIQ